MPIFMGYSVTMTAADASSAISVSEKPNSPSTWALCAPTSRRPGRLPFGLALHVDGARYRERVVVTGVIRLDDDVRRPQLLVVQRIGHARDAGVGDTCSIQPFGQRVLIELGDGLVEQRIDLGPVAHEQACRSQSARLLPTPGVPTLRRCGPLFVRVNGPRTRQTARRGTDKHP